MGKNVKGPKVPGSDPFTSSPYHNSNARTGREDDHFLNFLDSAAPRPPNPLRAFDNDAATACFCGWPLCIISLMFDDMVFLLDPGLRGIDYGLVAVVPPQMVYGCHHGFGEKDG